MDSPLEIERKKGGCFKIKVRLNDKLVMESKPNVKRGFFFSVS